jgi:hypothetical protein
MWLSQQDAARYLGLAVSTLAKLRRLGKGPPYSARLSRDPRYRLSDLDSWLSDCMASNTAEAKSIRAQGSANRDR